MLRVLPSGKRLYVAWYTRNGRDTRQRLGSVDELSLDEARARVLEIVNGTAPQPEPRVSAEPDAPRRPCFSELAREYLRRHVNAGALRESTARNHRRAIRHIVTEFGDRPLVDIRFADIEAYHRSMGARPSAANYYLRVLNHMFVKAAQWELFPHDVRLPTAGLQYFRERGRERFLTPNERRRLERALAASAGRTAHRKGAISWFHAAAIRLLALTGMRCSEVLDLEWSWIDRENRLIVLPDSKTGRSARPISQAVLELLDELEAQHRRRDVPWVIYGQNLRRVKRSSLGWAWRQLRFRAGLDDVRLHDLRHSAASDALNAGVPLAIVGEILGHKSTRTTERYAHVANRVAQAATDAMAAAILDAAQGRSTSSSTSVARTSK